MADDREPERPREPDVGAGPGDEPRDDEPVSPEKLERVSDGDRPGDESPDGEPVPRLPRGRGLRFNRAELFRIALFATMLVAVLAMRKPCSTGVAKFVESFSPQPDAAPARPEVQSVPGLGRLRRLSAKQIREAFPAYRDSGVAVPLPIDAGAARAANPGRRGRHPRRGQPGSRKPGLNH